MHQRAFLEIEQRRARVAIFAVLAHRIAPALSGAGILQLYRRHRHTVHRQHHIHRAVIVRMAGHLPRHGNLVLTVKCDHIRRKTMRRFEIG